MRASLLLGVTLASFTLSGCLAKAAADVVTAPVRIASKGVDLMTTSQSEADEKRGREIRKREERLGKLDRQYQKELAECREGSQRACNKATDIYAEMQLIMPTIPLEPQETDD